MSAPAEHANGDLKRSLGVGLLSLYGIGITVGAGIFVLIAEIIERAGPHAPLAFIVSALLAGLSALSFCELSARLPRAAGEALYVEQAFGSVALSRAVGLGVITAGTVSSAAIAVGFVGYLGALTAIPGWMGLVVIVSVFAGLACWGVRESVTVAAVVTVLEVGILLVVLAFGLPILADPSIAMSSLTPGFSLDIAGAVLAAALVAFFAFIGFEDIVNMAEETHDAPRTVPRAIIITLIVSTTLYVLISILAAHAPDVEAIKASDAPLADLFGQLAGGGSEIVAGIALFCVLNGVLVQMIMASRVLYGLARLERLPGWFARVHATRRTPVNAILTVAVLILALALAVPLEGLAEMTTFVTLTVFSLVNAALWRLKLRQGDVAPAMRVPLAVPVAGMVATLALLLFQIVRTVV